MFKKFKCFSVNHIYFIEKLLLNYAHWNYLGSLVVEFLLFNMVGFMLTNPGICFQVFLKLIDLCFFLLFQQLDEIVRQRNLHSLELFLSCAQKQLNVLLKEEPTSAENRDWHSQCWWYGVICGAANLHLANDEYIPIFLDCIIESRLIWNSW